MAINKELDRLSESSLHKNRLKYNEHIKTQPEYYKMTTFTTKEISKVVGINHDDVLKSIRHIAKNKNVNIDYEYDGYAFVSEEITLSYAVAIMSLDLIEFVENSQLDEIQVGFDNEAFEL